MNQSKEAPNILNSIFNRKNLVVATLALGGITLLLGGGLYIQFEKEKADAEALRKDIYPVEQVISRLEEGLYQSYPILLKLTQYVPAFLRKI